MPLHTDDPAREGNMTDEEYAAATQALFNEHGVAGLHTVPTDVMLAAVEAARARHGE